MPNQVTMWKTSDGKLHETEKKAKEHDLDRVREIFDKMTKFMLENGRLTHSEQFQLVMGMIQTYDQAASLSDKLNAILE